MRADRVHRVHRVGARRHAHGDLRAGARDHDVAGAFDRRRVEPEHADRVTRPQPVGDRPGADQRDAVEHARLAAEVVLRQLVARPRAVLEALDRDRPLVVVQRGEEADQREQRVRRGAAELAAVQRALERRERDRELAVSAQGLGQRRHADLPVAVVADDHQVRAHQVRMVVDDAEQALAAVLLGALDQDLDADRRVPAPRAQRRQVRGDARLVVGGTAAVQAPVALHRAERIALPAVARSGLDVVVRVEQDGGRARPFGEHARRLAGHLDHPHGRRAGVAQHARDELRRLVERGPREAVERDRGERHQALEIGADPRLVRAHGLPQGLLVHGNDAIGCVTLRACPTFSKALISPGAASNRSPDAAAWASSIAPRSSRSRALSR